jgi:hypothetical protein
MDFEPESPGYVPLGGRDSELQAIALLRNPQKLRQLLLERRWAEVVAPAPAPQIPARF